MNKHRILTIDVPAYSKVYLLKDESTCKFFKENNKICSCNKKKKNCASLTAQVSRTIGCARALWIAMVAGKVVNPH